MNLNEPPPLDTTVVELQYPILFGILNQNNFWFLLQLVVQSGTYEDAYSMLFNFFSVFGHPIEIIECGNFWCWNDVEYSTPDQAKEAAANYTYFVLESLLEQYEQ